MNIIHMDLLYSKLRNINSRLSEYSFPNLYLFRKNHYYSIVYDEDILITGKTYGGESFVMPTSDIRKYSSDYLYKLVNEYGMIYPIPEEWLSVFPAASFDFNFSEDDTDYIHTTEKLSTYSGKKLHKKKNLLNQFISQYNHKAFPLTEERLSDARQILTEWQQESSAGTLETDYTECLEAIDMYKRLLLNGVIFYVEMEPAGFIIGEELNQEVFGLHFAKGKRKFIGLYQFMFNSFAQVLPAKYCCLNFEQDLGKMTLRRAKSTYRPEHMEKKYKVTLK